MIPRPPRSTRTDTLSLHDALPICILGTWCITPVGAAPVLFGSGFCSSSSLCSSRYLWPNDVTSYLSDRGASGFPCFFRSEEHTSELQSLMRISYAVFCLKKKTTQNPPIKNNSPLTTD